MTSQRFAEELRPSFGLRGVPLNDGAIDTITLTLLVNHEAWHAEQRLLEQHLVRTPRTTGNAYLNIVVLPQCNQEIISALVDKIHTLKKGLLYEMFVRFLCFHPIHLINSITFCLQVALQFQQLPQ